MTDQTHAISTDLLWLQAILRGRYHSELLAITKKYNINCMIVVSEYAQWYPGERIPAVNYSSADFPGYLRVKMFNNMIYDARY